MIHRAFTSMLQQRLLRSPVLVFYTEYNLASPVAIFAGYKRLLDALQWKYLVNLWVHHTSVHQLSQFI